MENNMKKLEEYVRSIPDFPEEGIIFRDITSVLQDGEGLALAIDTMQNLVADLEIDVVAGAESRGFIFGTPIAYNLKKPFVLIRKKGKLPCETISREYDLEYGTATIEIHKDASGKILGTTEYIHDKVGRLIKETSIVSSSNTISILKKQLSQYQRNE